MCALRTILHPAFFQPGPLFGRDACHGRSPPGVSETPGMAQHEMTRTLVKSQPEVWTQCSDADSLGRHLSGSFG